MTTDDCITTYIFDGDKGGVGKSLAAMAFLDLCLRRGERPFLVEADPSNPDVYKAYNSVVDAELVNLDELDGWLVLLDRIATLKGRPVIVNKGARNNMSVAQYGDRLLEGVQLLDARVTTFWLINDQRDSVELLKAHLEAMPGIPVHVLRNEIFGDAAKFDLYNKSKTRQTLEKAGNRTLTFPLLARRVTAELYGERRLTLDAAATSTSFGNRIEVSRWRRAVDAMFDQVLPQPLDRAGNA